jgi:uncharacterized membrane protein
MHALLRRVTAIDAHHRLLIALVVAGGSFAGAWHFGLPVRVLFGWNVFAIASTALAWAHILGAHARTSVRETKLQDSSRTAIFVLVVGAALASLFAVGVLLVTAKGLSSGDAARHALLAIGTVICSWSLTHTIFTLRYAHLFYRHVRGQPADAAGSGLLFPEEKHPDYLDFAYFSFVIGMTCQVSDVQVTARAIRRTAFLHGLLSFVFNTVILALSLNLASGLV